MDEGRADRRMRGAQRATYTYGPTLSPAPRFMLDCDRCGDGYRLILTLAFVVLGCDYRDPDSAPLLVRDAADVLSEACEVQGAPRGVPDETVVLQFDPNELCRVVAVRKLTITPSLTGSHPDPYWPSVAMDGRGVVYTAATHATGPGTIAVWDPDGNFRRTVGRPGDGPGELLGRSPGRVYIGRGDSLWVHEAGRLSAFGPEGSFGRHLTAPAIGRGYDSVALTDSGYVVSSGPVSRSDPDSWFHVTDGLGVVIRSFGPIDWTEIPMEYRERRTVPQRSLAYAGEGRFWAAPPAGTKGDTYLLQLWTLNGRLVSQLKRDPGWLQRNEGSEGASGLPFFRVTVDEKGLLWVTAVVKDRRWRKPRADDEETRALMSELYDLRYEVINPLSATVLASGVVDSLPGEDEVGHPPISRILPGTSVSYRPVPDATGLITLEFFDLRLVR